MIEKKEVELKAALAEAERRLCKLGAEREGLEEKIEAINRQQQPDIWLLNETREELALVDDRVNVAQIEVRTLRIALAKIELPRAQAAVAPAKTAFEEARAKYLAAADECNRLGAKSDAARFRVGNIENAIRSDEGAIEEFRRSLASSKARAA